MSRSISVIVVDDHAIVRTGIVKLLQDVVGIDVVAQAESGEEALKIVREKLPKVVLLDIAMPGIGGLETVRKILRIDPDLKIIILTSHQQEPLPSKVLELGVHGYLTKEGGLEEIVKAIKSVHSGKRYLSPDIAQNLAIKSINKAENPIDNLSSRELQVMLMIAKGEKVKSIANKLCVTEKTINSYRYRLFTKLEVNSDVELAHLAIRYQILEQAIPPLTLVPK